MNISDASCNEYGSAIETLVTAISLIKQSKVANDDRCKILISSLQVKSFSYVLKPKIQMYNVDDPLFRVIM